MANTNGFAPRRAGNGFAVRGTGLRRDSEARLEGSCTLPVSNRHAQFSNVSTELTRNTRYVVSKLAATPSLLSSDKSNNLAALIDECTSYGILTAGENIFTWNYNSVDAIPTTVQLPGMPSNYGFPPLALLVSPSAGSSEPGVVSINTHTGHVRFYENVSSVSSIGLLQHHKGVESIIKLSDREYITIAENVEPAGVLMTTSQGRVILLCLRDFVGRPTLKATDIIKRQTGFFSNVLEKSRQIVSINPGAVLGQGERIVALISGKGDFQIWSCSSDGQSKRVFHEDLMFLLTNSIAELYPNAVNRLEVLDLKLLSNVSNGDVFLLLASFENGPNETNYILFTVNKEGEQLSVFSAYKLNTYSSPFDQRPTLYVPSPGAVGFIVFENNVVLTELVTKLDHTLNLKRKWEDIISFRSDVNIIGSGSQSMQKEQNGSVVLQGPSVLVIIPQIGVVKIEVLELTSGETLSQYQSSPTSFLKSHIEQGVFYGEDNQNPIEFDLPEGWAISQSDIEVDLIKVADEILSSNSAYLPSQLSSMKEHLHLRQKKLGRLFAFATKNFKNRVSHQVFLELLSNLEKVTAACSLEHVISSNNSAQAFLNQSIKALCGETEFFSCPNKFFLNGLSKLSLVLSNFFQSLLNSNDSSLSAAQIIADIFTPVLELEKNLKYDSLQLNHSQLGNELIWFGQNNLYETVDLIFRHFVKTHHGNQADPKLSQVAVNLTELLFYQIEQVTMWWKSQTQKSRAIKDAIASSQAFFSDNSSFWTKSLVLFNAKTEALSIAETYHDLKSLVEILDETRESAATEEAIVNVQERFAHYFNKFGYEFAFTLYNYYISVEKYQVLFLEFQEYSHYLKRFFLENDHSKISWIKYIFDEDLKKAAEVLLNYSQNHSETQTDKKLRLNIAKLSAIAAIPDMDNIDNLTQIVLDEIQEELDYAEAQALILEQITEFIRSDNDPLVQVDLIVKDLLNSRYNDGTYPIVKRSFERALARLLTNKALSINEMIDLFTLLDCSKTGSKLNFHFAMKVLHLSNLSSRAKTTNEKLIWKRAILSDDWTKLVKAQNKSNEYKKELNEETITFQTLLSYFQDELFLPNNDCVISLPNFEKLVKIDNDAELLLRFNFIGGVEIDQLRKELLRENDSLKEIYETFQLDQFIKGSILTTNERSGANKAINYNTLTIEN